MYNNFDDFDSHIQPEELQCDNPIDEDFEPTEEWANELPDEDWDFEPSSSDWELEEVADFFGNDSFEECDDFNDGENW